MAWKTLTGLAAIIITAVAFFFVVVSFCTPYWLENDGQIPDPKFIRIGLWEVCFVNFEDFRHHYDTRFTGCWWVFEEEYYIIDDFLLPGFFIATQFFFTLCMTLVLVGVFLTWLYCFCGREHDKYVLLLLSNGAILSLAGISGFIAVCIFGAKGDGRDWMPNWQHNNLGWSFAFGVIGSLLLLPAGALFLVEGRRARFRQLKGEQQHQQQGPAGYGWGIEMQKPAQTDI